MPGGILRVQLTPDGRLKILEDGQINLRLLGNILSRRRVGSINPSPQDLSKYEVTMTLIPDQIYKLSDLYTLKAEAVKAEAEEVIKQEFLQQADDSPPPQQEEQGRKGRKGEGTPKQDTPCTGNSMGRCPICQYPLYPMVEVLKTRDSLGNKTKVVYKCACTPNSSS